MKCLVSPSSVTISKGGATDLYQCFNLIKHGWGFLERHIFSHPPLNAQACLKSMVVNNY